MKSSDFTCILQVMNIHVYVNHVVKGPHHRHVLIKRLVSPVDPVLCNSLKTRQNTNKRIFLFGCWAFNKGILVQFCVWTTAFSDSFVAPVSYLRSYRLAAAASRDWGRNPLELHDNLPPETDRRR